MIIQARFWDSLLGFFSSLSQNSYWILILIANWFFCFVPKFFSSLYLFFIHMVKSLLQFDVFRKFKEVRRWLFFILICALNGAELRIDFFFHSATNPVNSLPFIAHFFLCRYWVEIPLSEFRWRISPLFNFSWRIGDSKKKILIYNYKIIYILVSFWLFFFSPIINGKTFFFILF